MKISIHIERLILDGLQARSQDGALVQAAVEAELSRLITESGNINDLKQNLTQTRVTAPVLQLNPSHDVHALGRQIGAGIFSAFSGLKR